MYFPKYWARAKQGGVFAWGWSDVSTAEALADGKSRVARIIERLENGPWEKWDLDPYGYPDRPMREEVIHEFAPSDGSAAVTRNSYGCLVLNTTHALFVDIDEPAAEPDIFRAIASLFGKKKTTFDGTVMEQAKQWTAARSGWGWRVYRTKAGIRLLATHQPIAAENPLTEEVFHAFKADILYRKLCVNQKCYRARLTPKSWRCGVDRPVHRWPWLTPEDEAEFRQWEQSYRAVAADYATCKLLGQVGNATIHSALAPLVEFHDKATGVGSDKPLA